MRKTALLGFLLTCAAPAFGQTLWSFPTETAGTAEIAPDLNGDGRPEVLVGDPGPYGVGRPGLVNVVSGAHAELLRTWYGLVTDDYFGSSIAMIGDVDGDGAADVACGAPGAGVDPSHRPYVQILSGANGNVIRQIDGPDHLSAYGSDLAAVGDVDGDGVPDLAVGASGTAYPSVSGFAEVVSGASGALLWRSAAVGQGGQPISLARHGDLDGDGASEVLVGFAALDRAEILAGATGASLRVLTPPAGLGFGYSLGFGASVAAGADYDGDDLADILVGAPYEALTDPSIGGYEGWVQTGSVYAFSGTSGLLYRAPGDQFHGETHGGFGTSLANLGDMNGDGIGDYVTGTNVDHWGCCHYDPGALSIHSGSDGAMLSTAPGSGGSYGAAGDWNADGWPDYLVSTSKYSSYSKTEIFAGGPPPPVLNPACAGSSGGCQPLTYFAGIPSPHSQPPFTVFAYGFESASRGFLLIGRAEQFTPFASGATGALCVAGPVVRFAAESASFQSSCPVQHSVSLEQALQGGPLVPGFPFVGQMLSTDRSASGIQGAAESFVFTVLP